MRTVHVVTGLPRTGSTLLCNILSQNPKIHTTSTSALVNVLGDVKDKWNGWKGHQTDREQGADDNQRRVLQAILDSYHATDRPIVFDKNRAWMGNVEMLEFVLGRKAKLIITVRTINDILASFERLHRDNVSHRMHKGPKPSTNTILGRCEWLLDNETGMIGVPFVQLQDCFIKKLRDRMCIIEYDALCRAPEETLGRIYKFIGEEPFEHDFDNIPQYTKEDDGLYGYDDTLHEVRPKLKKRKSNAIDVIGKKAVEKFRNFEFWRKLK